MNIIGIKGIVHNKGSHRGGGGYVNIKSTKRKEVKVWL